MLSTRDVNATPVKAKSCRCLQTGFRNPRQVAFADISHFIRGFQRLFATRIYLFRICEAIKLREITTGVKENLPESQSSPLLLKRNQSSMIEKTLIRNTWCRLRAGLK